MGKSNKIRVLVVEDSLLFRAAIAKVLTADEQIEIVAVAANPSEARDKIMATRPDVITCDIEMPIMDGIKFVRWLLPQYFVPIIMVSSISDKVFEALEAGAVDFVVKPDQKSTPGLKKFGQDLIHKIKAAANVKAPVPKVERASTGRITIGIAQDREKIIALGASTGGTEAIYSILRVLPPTVPGIVVAQHIPPIFSQMFAQRLDNQTDLAVKEAETGDYVDPGTVLVAPGNRHMEVKRVGKRYQVKCYPGEKVNGHCPSVDVLFNSTAAAAGGSTIGILLTGMGYDGARGLLNIRCKGGRTIGQDQESSVVYGMPKVAQDIGAVEIQTSLEKIPHVLINLLK
ncbi:MAG: chemotaxis response regulator protein-glutamate methylesterase [Firmicutes bacterium]|nr:chemotaxis response regulator protein-glutamate methylesterase [Bacillota bacterium]